jgi:hypothetical protein
LTLLFSKSAATLAAAASDSLLPILVIMATVRISGAIYVKSATIAAWQLLNSFGWLDKALKYKFGLAVVYDELFTS